MERPAKEIAAIFESLSTTLSPDNQKATIEKCAFNPNHALIYSDNVCRYFAQDAAFQHPIYNIRGEKGSRDRILSIYQ